MWCPAPHEAGWSDALRPTVRLPGCENGDFGPGRVSAAVWALRVPPAARSAPHALWVTCQPSIRSRFVIWRYPYRSNRLANRTTSVGRASVRSVHAGASRTCPCPRNARVKSLTVFEASETVARSSPSCSVFTWPILPGSRGHPHWSRIHDGSAAEGHSIRGTCADKEAGLSGHFRRRALARDRPRGIHVLIGFRGLLSGVGNSGGESRRHDLVRRSQPTDRQWASKADRQPGLRSFQGTTTFVPVARRLPLRDRQRRRDRRSAPIPRNVCHGERLRRAPGSADHRSGLSVR